jgi:hypothetical protein
LGSFHLFRPDLVDSTIIEPDNHMPIGWPPAGQLIFQNRYTYFKIDPAFVKYEAEPARHRCGEEQACERPQADAGDLGVRNYILTTATHP